MTSAVLEEALKKAALAWVSVGDGPATISAVAVALTQCGVPIRDLTLRTPTLDDVFLELTGTRIDNETTKKEAA